MEIITFFKRKEPVPSYYQRQFNLTLTYLLTKLVSIHKNMLLYLILSIQCINFHCKET